MISIITVCHKSAKLMPDYVASFLRHNEGVLPANKVEFIFVENSGDPETDVFAATLRANGYAARVIEVENRGFGAGSNAGAKVARGNLLVFANPDIRFLTALNELELHFHEKSWGTIRQVDCYGSTRAFDLLPEYRSLSTELVRPIRFLHQFSLLRNFCYPIGSFMVIPLEAFIMEGGFDERFFLYYEEAEFSRRLHARLGPPKYCGEISILHEAFGSQTSRDFTFQQEARGMVTYAYVTGQPHLVKRRLTTLRLLAFLSQASARRIPFLRQAMTAGADKFAYARQEE